MVTRRFNAREYHGTVDCNDAQLPREDKRGENGQQFCPIDFPPTRPVRLCDGLAIVARMKLSEWRCQLSFSQQTEKTSLPRTRTTKDVLDVFPSLRTNICFLITSSIVGKKN